MPPRKSKRRRRTNKRRNAYGHLNLAKRKSVPRISPRNNASPFDLTRIGAQDIAFTDNVLNQSYRYEAICPYYKHELPKRCHSLKDWSARKLVEALFSNQNDELKSCESNRWLSYLIDTCPVSDSWTIWKRVWHYILLSERDTPAVFSIFYSKFGSNSSFYCHHIPSLRAHISARSTNEDRTSYITMNCLSRRHRFETLYANVHMPSLVNDLNRYRLLAPDYLVLLNLSGIDLSKSYHYLTSLSSLCFLNVSGCNIDSASLMSIFMAMKASKLQKLSCIVLNDNPGLDYFNEKTEIPSQIQYLEMSANGDGGSHVSSFISIANAGFAGLADSLKLQYLLKRHLVQIPGLHEQLLLDYRLIDQMYDPTADIADKCIIPWLKRSQVHRVRGVKSYIRKYTKRAKRSTGARSSSSSLNDSESLKRRKVTRVNFKKFFDM